MKLLLFCVLLVASIEGIRFHDYLDYMDYDSKPADSPGCTGCMRFIDQIKAIPGVETMSKEELESHAKDWCDLAPPKIKKICMDHLPGFLGKIYDIIHEQPGPGIDTRDVCTKLKACEQSLHNPFYKQNLYYPSRQRGYYRGRY